MLCLFSVPKHNNCYSGFRNSIAFNTFNTCTLWQNMFLIFKKRMKTKKKHFRLKNSTAVTRLVWCWFYCRQAYNKLAKLRFLSHNIISPRKTRSISQTAHSGAILWKSWMSYLHSAFFGTYEIDSISLNIKWNWFWYRIEYRLPNRLYCNFQLRCIPRSFNKMNHFWQKSTSWQQDSCHVVSLFFKYV